MNVRTMITEETLSTVKRKITGIRTKAMMTGLNGEIKIIPTTITSPLNLKV